MPGFLLHLGANVSCLHFGKATPAFVNPRVLVSNQPTVTMVSPYLVAGCTLPSPAGGPCVSAQFTTAATRVTSNGQALLLFDSQAKCAPTGTPLVIVSTQTKVTGT